MGRWSQAEHFRFIKGCLLYGNYWKKVKDCVKTRSSAQIRSHAQKFLIKLCKKYKKKNKFYNQLDNFHSDRKNFNFDLDKDPNSNIKFEDPDNASNDDNDDEDGKILI